MHSIAVTIRETARMTGVGRTTIYKLIREKRLESFKVGARRLVTIKSILDVFGGSEVTGE